jgi:DNA-directed RNA polymerase subunit RPC12/RpoP
MILAQTAILMLRASGEHAAAVRIEQACKGYVCDKCGAESDNPFILNTDKGLLAYCPTCNKGRLN